MTVGENVWIWTRVSIMPGVRIGDHAVIGAGAVVLEDVPTNKVYAGIPARPIRDLE